MKMIRMNVNGSVKSGRARPGQTLLDFLREELGCTEVKHGCGRGDCGSCSVILNGELVNSCLVMALQAEESEIITSKGLGTANNLHPIQAAFEEAGAFQCGYCTPGMVLAAKALLDKVPVPTEEQIRRGLSGNLCRCTGYKKIIEAVELASEKLKK